MSVAAPWDEGSLRSWLQDATERTGIPGASLAVLAGDTLLRAEAGVLNVETGTSVRPDSVFQIGSTGKVLTAALVLQLVDEGRLGLDEGVGDRLGGLIVGGANVGDVTVRQLLDHTSGLPGHYFHDFGPGPDSIGRYVDSLSTQQRIHPPGAMFSYCNAGYVVAGRLAEVVTNECFADLFRGRIAQPLGLSSTTTQLEDIADDRAAAGHEIGSAGVHELAALQTAAWSSAPAGSIMLSTATELVLIGASLSRPVHDSAHRLVSPQSLEAMTTPSVHLPCQYWGRQAQCLGWGLDDRGGSRVLLHGGGTTGQAAMLLAVPERDVTIAVLTNSAYGGLLLGEAEQWLLSSLGIPAPQPVPDADYELADEEADALTGEYTDIWTTSTVTRGDAGVVLSREIHASAVSPAMDLPPTPLSAIGPRLLTAGRGRPFLFVGVDPDDDASPVGYLHQLNASRSTRPVPAGAP